MDWIFDHVEPKLSFMRHPNVGALHAWQDTTGGMDQGLHGA